MQAAERHRGRCGADQMRDDPRGPAQQPGYRCGPDWGPRCSPFPRTAVRTENAQTPARRDDPRAPMESSDGDAIISLYEAAKRLGLLAKSRSNWTPTLRKVAADIGLEIRFDPEDGTATMRAADLPRLRAATERHFDRRRIATGNPKAARPIKGEGRAR